MRRSLATLKTRECKAVVQHLRKLVYLLSCRKKEEGDWYHNEAS